MKGGGRPGFTLIEMLVVIVMISFLGGIMALLIKETLDIEKVQTAGFDRLLRENLLADQFRADVGQADDLPAQFGDYRAGPQVLILHMPNAGHIVYVWTEDKFHRLAFAVNKVGDRQIPVGDNLLVEFEQTSGPAKRVILRLHPLKNRQAVSGQSLEFAAALGGDWR